MEKGSIGKSECESYTFLSDLLNVTPDRKKWNEASLLTLELLAELMTSDEFGAKIVDAIVRTEEATSSKYSKEHGFIVLNQDLQNPSLYISPVFEGEVGSIDLDLASTEFRKSIGVQANRTLDFHTHTNGPKSIFEAVFPHISFPMRDEFSLEDLECFYRTARDDWSGFIFAIGIKETEGIKGKVLLISCNDLESYQNFNADELEQRTAIFKLSYPTKTPTQVYRQAGLNAEVLSVSLNSSKAFDPREVARVADVLTRRK